MSAAIHPSVSRETKERLAAYATILRKWNPKINLVSPATLSELEARHIEDSAQIEPLAPTTDSWADLGSGGGFPGLVIAALRAETSPGFKMTLIESDIRKSTFLREAARAMDLNVEILVARAESVRDRRFPVISARALAPLGKLLGLAHRMLDPSGVALFPKGANHAAEVDEARKEWQFTLKSIPSVTSPDAVILKVKDITRA